MYGTISIPAPAWDIESNDLIGAIIREAKYQKRQEAKARQEMKLTESAGEFYVFSAHNRAVWDASLRAKAAIRPLRSMIEQRTRQEREQAESEARMGQIRFTNAGCPEDECDDCERPVWHHVLAADNRILCPFGREYWTLAKAILSVAVDGKLAEQHETLRAIATR